MKLGVQVGTTSYTAATAVGANIPVSVYNTNGDAKMALNTGEIDALVADLPTAFSVDALRTDGTLTKLQERWLANAGKALCCPRSVVNNHPRLSPVGARRPCGAAWRVIAA
ncbi:MAG: polar amino acid transport system substrate-binding protein, partial [Mycobacterium sp.]|nr:polar amino acid transport system substrate-binding protein [Mycobacterium sp.]